MRPTWRLFCVILAAVFLFLPSLFVSAAVRADDLKLEATLGIGGRFRAGSWFPVTVHLTNTSGAAVSGQIQVLEPTGEFGRGGSFGTRSRTVFARPVSVPSSSGVQNFTVYARGLDSANIAVQFVGGAARGDGRVLARVSTVTATRASALGGLPVSDRDLLLVGLADDPVAWTFLNSQKWGLTHGPDGPVPASPTVSAPRSYGSRPPRRGMTSFVPPSVQVAAALTGDLPDKAAGYSGVDAILLRADAPLDALTEAQIAAVRGWVASGGELIVCGGADSSRLTAASWLTEMVPTAGWGAPRTVTVTLAITASALTLRPKAGTRVIQSSGGALSSSLVPLVVAGAYGAGTVVAVAFDPTTLPFQHWAGGENFWKMLATAGESRTSSLTGFVAQRQEAHGGYGYGWNMGLSSVVTRAPALDAPGTLIIGLFLLTYVLILVPVNYLILKRLDRREWAWATIPALVLIFALGTYGVGYASKGGAMFVNRAAIVETTAGQTQAGVYAELGLFSPHRTVYDIALTDSNALAATPVSRDDPWRGGRGGAMSGDSSPARLVQTASGVTIQDALVNMWAMRAFDTQTVGDLGGPIDAVVAAAGPHGDLLCTLANHSRVGLTDCALLYNGQWQTLGELKPGGRQSATLSRLLPLPPAPPPGGPRRVYYSSGGRFQIPTGGGASGGEFSYAGRYAGRDPNLDSAARDVHVRLQAGLADFARSLGDDNGYAYAGSSSVGPTSFAPRRDEAVMIGWSRDPSLPGPVPSVNGAAVVHNDVSLVIVHIPTK